MQPFVHKERCLAPFINTLIRSTNLESFILRERLQCFYFGVFWRLIRIDVLGRFEGNHIKSN